MLFPTDELPGWPIRGHTPLEPFARLVGHLVAYKGWLAGAIVSGVLLTGLGLCFVTPLYTAEAVVIVDSRRDKLADAESALSSIVIDQYQSALKSELELLRSVDLARYVITSLDLLRTPEYASALTHTPMARRFAEWRNDIVSAVQAALGPRFETESRMGSADEEDLEGAEKQNAVKIFQQAFTAENDPKSLTIRMSYRSASPRLAAAVTNAVLQRYLAADQEMKAAANERSEAWLEGRIEVLHADLEAAEHKMEDFRARHELATEPGQQPLQQLLLQLQSRQMDAQAALAAMQAKVAQNQQTDGSNTLAAGTDVLASRLIQQLRQQEAALLTDQGKLSTVLQPNSPSMAILATQLARLRTTISGEVSRFAQSNAAELQLAHSRVADLAEQIGALQAKINAANTADITQRSLQSDVAAKRSVLDAFTSRYDQNAGPPLNPPDSRVVSWASVPVDASSPHYAIVLVAGTLGWTGLAFLLSLGRERLRCGFGSLNELEDELNLVVAGLAPELPRHSVTRNRLSAAANPPSLRELALTVRALTHAPSTGGRGQVMLVTSPVAGEGKSTVALSLARSVASGGQRCLLIDADLRNPSLHASLGMSVTPGLVEMTVDCLAPERVIQQADGEQFALITAGRPAQDTLSAFTMAGFGAALDKLRQSYDVIVIDSAPVLLASEGLFLVAAADLTLFLVKWRTTPREVAREAVRLVARSSPRPCLAVLSRANLRRMGSSGRRLEEQYRALYRVS